MEKTGCKIICGAPTTLAVKGLMMMINMIMILLQKISPGSKEEIRKFTDVSASNTSLLVEITAPKLLVHTQDKAFLELLYNR